MVMYRDFATRKARGLGLVGYVRNLEDGSVEAYAEGSKGNLEKWLKRLEKGSILSHVEKVDARWGMGPASGMPHKSFDSFDIVF